MTSPAIGKSLLSFASVSRRILNTRRTIFRPTTSCVAKPVSIPITHRMPLVTINQSLRESLKKHGIIPDVVDDFTPTTMISVAYPSSNKEVSLGNTLQPDDAQEKPVVQITPEGADESLTYTIILTDPDAPSRDDPKWSEFCHWIVTDVKLRSLEALGSARTQEAASIDLSGTSEVVEYMGPAPPAKTGKHRYVFLLYRNGPSKKLEAPSERKRWGHEGYRKGAREFADKYGLSLVGANFFFAQSSKQ